MQGPPLTGSETSTVTGWVIWQLVCQQANGGTGRVVVVKGSPGDWPLPAIGDLEFLEDNTPAYVGTSNAAIGGIIKPVGDVDGDSLDDFIIGDPANNRIILLLGSNAPNASNSELNGTSPLEAIIESSDASQSLTGLTPNHVAAAGDVNNDGLSRHLGQRNR